MEERTVRILVVTDTPNPGSALTEAMRHRSQVGDVQFRVVVPNPARAEVHLLHPERHDRAEAAEQVLRQSVPVLELAAGGPVIASVSVRHDPMDAIEETIFSEPIDEIMLAVAPHGLASRLHQDLEHRLHHFGLPVTVVAHDPA